MKGSSPRLLIGNMTKHNSSSFSYYAAVPSHFCLAVIFSSRLNRRSYSDALSWQFILTCVPRIVPRFFHKKAPASKMKNQREKPVLSTGLRDSPFVFLPLRFDLSDER